MFSKARTVTSLGIAALCTTAAFMPAAASAMNSPKSSGRRLKYAGRSALVAGILAVVAVCGAGSAQAEMVPSPYYHFNPSYQTGKIGPDCNIAFGTVVDPAGTQDAFDVISGVQVACHTNKRHSIYAEVSQYYSRCPGTSPCDTHGAWEKLGTWWWNQPSGYGMGSSMLIAGVWKYCGWAWWLQTTTVTIDGVTRHPESGEQRTQALRGC